MPTLAVLVQLYDEHGNSHVSSADMRVTASLGVESVTLSSFFAWRGPSGRRLTRRYKYATLPPSWFAPGTASADGSTATVTTALSGGDTHTASFTVHGTPAWFDDTLSEAGILAHVTSDAAGATARGYDGEGGDETKQKCCQTDG